MFAIQYNTNDLLQNHNTMFINKLSIYRNQNLIMYIRNASFFTMIYQLYLFISFYVFFNVFGEGSWTSRDYGLGACYRTDADMTVADWFLLSLTTIT